MGRIFLLYYDYKHTSGNHAGMAHLARALKASNPAIRLIRQPKQEYKGGWVPALLYTIGLAIYLRVVLRPNDRVVFFEYLSGDFGFQDTITRLLRRWGVRNRFSGIVHLGGEQLLELYKTTAGIRARLDRIDQAIVFGSSLATFLRQSVGYRKQIVSTYHYADVEYYQPAPEAAHGARPLQVLFLGSLKRNMEQLADIITRTGEGVVFHVCAGGKHYPQLAALPHVVMHAYMSEAQLRSLMQACDVNLSVFYDTVGSNAITSTLAVGLVQVASNVGSIADYGDETNSFLCDSPAEFVQAIRLVANDRNRLESMKQHARRKAEKISLANFVSEFNALFEPHVP